VTVVDEAWAHLQAAKSALTSYRDLIDQITDPQDVSALLLEITEVRKVISGERGKSDEGIFRQTEIRLLSLMDTKVLHTPLGPFETRRSPKRTQWRFRPRDDQPGLLDVLVARVADDWTGEPPAVFAAKVADEIAECVGLSYGKVNALKARGIKPGDFCREEESTYSVQLPPAHKDVAA
jgi:hypothetical protein